MCRVWDVWAGYRWGRMGYGGGEGTGGGHKFKPPMRASCEATYEGLLYRPPMRASKVTYDGLVSEPIYVNIYIYVCNRATYEGLLAQSTDEGHL